MPEEGINIIDLMVCCGLVKSRGEARRLIEQGGVKVNGEKVASTYATVSREQLCAGAKIKKGKKEFHKALLQM